MSNLKMTKPVTNLDVIGTFIKIDEDLVETKRVLYVDRWNKLVDIAFDSYTTRLLGDFGRNIHYNESNKTNPIDLDISFDDYLIGKDGKENILIRKIYKKSNGKVTGYDIINTKGEMRRYNKQEFTEQKDNFHCINAIVKDTDVTILPLSIVPVELEREIGEPLYIDDDYKSTNFERWDIDAFKVWASRVGVIYDITQHNIYRAPVLTVHRAYNDDELGTMIKVPRGVMAVDTTRVKLDTLLMSDTIRVFEMKTHKKNWIDKKPYENTTVIFDENLELIRNMQLPAVKDVIFPKNLKVITGFESEQQGDFIIQNDLEILDNVALYNCKNAKIANVGLLRQVKFSIFTKLEIGEIKKYNDKDIEPFFYTQAERVQPEWYRKIKSNNAMEVISDVNIQSISKACNKIEKSTVDTIDLTEEYKDGILIRNCEIKYMKIHKEANQVVLDGNHINTLDISELDSLDKITHGFKKNTVENMILNRKLEEITDFELCMPSGVVDLREFKNLKRMRRSRYDFEGRCELKALVIRDGIEIDEDMLKDAQIQALFITNGVKGIKQLSRDIGTVYLMDNKEMEELCKENNICVEKVDGFEEILRGLCLTAPNKNMNLVKAGMTQEEIKMRALFGDYEKICTHSDKEELIRLITKYNYKSNELPLLTKDMVATHIWNDDFVDNTIIMLMNTMIETDWMNSDMLSIQKIDEYKKCGIHYRFISNKKANKKVIIYCINNDEYGRGIKELYTVAIMVYDKVVFMGYSDSCYLNPRYTHSMNRDTDEPDMTLEEYGIYDLDEVSPFGSLTLTHKLSRDLWRYYSSVRKSVPRRDSLYLYLDKYTKIDRNELFNHYRQYLFDGNDYRNMNHEYLFDDGVYTYFDAGNCNVIIVDDTKNGEYNKGKITSIIKLNEENLKSNQTLIKLIDKLQNRTGESQYFIELTESLIK